MNQSACDPSCSRYSETGVLKWWQLIILSLVIFFQQLFLLLPWWSSLPDNQAIVRPRLAVAIQRRDELQGGAIAVVVSYEGCPCCCGGHVESPKPCSALSCFVSNQPKGGGYRRCESEGPGFVQLVIIVVKSNQQMQVGDVNRYEFGYIVFSFASITTDLQSQEDLLERNSL